MTLPNVQVDTEIRYKDKRIVLYDPICEEKNNVFCVDNGGNIVWQISRNTQNDVVQFTWIGKDLHAVDFHGVEYKINPKDGTTKIIGYER